MKKILIFILLNLSISAFAAQPTSASIKLANTPAPTAEISSIPDNSIFVFADLLQWKAREDAANNWAQIITPAGRNQDAEVIGVPFKWDTGFRVGMGYNAHDNWDGQIYYTGYHTSANDSVAASNVYSPYLGNFWIDNNNGAGVGPYYQAANVKWTIDYDTLDLALGHTFHIKNIVDLHPLLGLKLATINQNINTNWYNPTSETNMVTVFTEANESIDNDFSGVGPSVGLDVSFFLYQSSRYTLNLIGDFSGALLWGNWSFKYYYTNNAPATVTIDNSEFTGAAPMISGFLGIGWTGHYNTVDTTIRLGYEQQVWYNQLQFYSLNGGRLNEQLSLQGGDLSICINFK